MPCPHQFLVLLVRAITAIDVHHRPNEILLKILTRNIGSIPTTTPPEHTLMKRHIILSLAFSVLATSAFATDLAHPVSATQQPAVIAEGGSDRLQQNRVAEGGSDRLQQNRVAEGGSDRLTQNRA